MMEHKPKLLYIVRGLPGSGKSTLAEELMRGFRSMGFHASRHEADDYFMRRGKYCFDQTKLNEAHAFCQRGVDFAMQAGEIVAVANTFTRRWEMEPYLKMAKKYGYRVTELTCNGRHGNTHNVPEEAIQRMAARWED